MMLQILTNKSWRACAVHGKRKTLFGTLCTRNGAIFLIYYVVFRYTLRADLNKEAVPVAEIVTRARDGIYIHFDKRS